MFRTLFTKSNRKPWFTSPKEAVGLIKSKNRVYVHGVGMFPKVLMQALAERSDLEQVELNHLHIEDTNPCTGLKPFHTVNYFIGSNQRKAVAHGQATQLPCFLSEFPRLMRQGIRTPDVALIQVSPPDQHGFCSLGLEVCTAYAAVETSKIVIAQMNPQVPRTHGSSHIHISCLDAIVQVDEPLPTVKSAPLSKAELAIGKHLSELIPDGATLQMGIGGIPNAVLESLKNHKNLGVHTEMFSDGLIDLVESGVVNNSQKQIYRGMTVTSFAMGTERLHQWVHDNPTVVFKDIARVNNPNMIALNPRVTAINAAVEIDLTGQVCADSIGTRMLSGVGGQLDFERGAALSEHGLPIICLKSLTKTGASTIVPTLQVGAGVTTSRFHVHYVATEYGVVNLFGKDLLERARLLISIAHPSHQAVLAQQAFERYQVVL